jgi:hypothetical protein
MLRMPRLMNPFKAYDSIFNQLSRLVSIAVCIAIKAVWYSFLLFIGIALYASKALAARRVRDVFRYIWNRTRAKDVEEARAYVVTYHLIYLPTFIPGTIAHLVIQVSFVPCPSKHDPQTRARNHDLLCCKYLPSRLCANSYFFQYL